MFIYITISSEKLSIYKGDEMYHADSNVMDVPADNVSFFFNNICKMRSREHIIFPPVALPSSLFIQSVGQEMLHKIVLHHYSLLRQLASLNFYVKEYQTFMAEVTKISHFMIEVFGCSKIYTNEYGLDAMSSMQTPFLMDERSREIWLRLFAQSLRDLSFPSKNLAEFWDWIELFSLRLLDTSSLKSLPKRFYFESIKAEFESSSLD